MLIAFAWWYKLGLCRLPGEISLYARVVEQSDDWSADKYSLSVCLTVCLYVCMPVILNTADVSPVHRLSTTDAEYRLPTTSRSQRRLRGVELVARRVRLCRHDGCWGRVTATTTHDDDDEGEEDELSDNDELPRQQLLNETTTPPQSAFTAGALSPYNDYTEFSERKSVFCFYFYFSVSSSTTQHIAGWSRS